MLLFLDCEFTGLRQDTTLISLALVSEDGKQFYAEFTDYDRSQVGEWVRKNVLVNLWGGVGQPGVTYIRNTRQEIAVALTQWLWQISGPDFGVVGDVIAWDWVLFCDLFAERGALPASIFYIPVDLSTLLWAAGYDPDVSREDFAGLNSSLHKHGALYDAQVIRLCYNRLVAEGKLP